MSTQSISISFWLPTQVALLVLFYGGFAPSLPWWVVWLPSLIILAALGVVIAVFIIIVVAFVITIAIEKIRHW